MEAIIRGPYRRVITRVGGFIARFQSKYQACRSQPFASAFVPGYLVRGIRASSQWTAAMRAEWISERTDSGCVSLEEIGSATLIQDAERAPEYRRTGPRFDRKPQHFATSVCNSYGYKYSIIYLMRIRDMGGRGLEAG